MRIILENITNTKFILQLVSISYMSYFKKIGQITRL